MEALVFGGGKIARGFIAQLLHRSGYSITFVDMNEKLIHDLNNAKKYYVNVMGNEKESEWIDDFRFIETKDADQIAEALLDADIAFSSVGGKNLESLSRTIAGAFAKTSGKWGDKQITLITCENWKNPADQLRNFVLENLADDNMRQEFEEHIGISEAAILRSGIEPAPEMLSYDSNAVSVTDYWELPVDKDKFKGADVKLKGIRYMNNFGHFLQRKIYTFNTTNATIAYIGMLKGFVYLSDAANDPEILELVANVHKEMNGPIAAQLGVTLEEQEAFSQAALRKYRDKSVIDYLERHCRDPLRKLGPEDRIVGTSRMIEKQGQEVHALALTLAAAIYYNSANENDESAKELVKLRKEKGAEGVLAEICRVDINEPLGKAVLESIERLRNKGWIHE